MKLATFITNIFSQIQTRKICIVNRSQNLQKPRTKNTKRNYEYTMCTKRYKYSYVKNKIIQHIIYIYFLHNFDCTYDIAYYYFFLSIDIILYIIELLIELRILPPLPVPSNPSNSCIQLSHELRNEAVNISPPFVGVAGSGLFNIKELTAPEAVDNASHYRSCRPGRARQLIPRRTRE